MTERRSPSENTCSAKLSQEEIQMPLSPILGSGQSLKKLIKNRKERQKRESNKFSQNLENVIKVKEDTDKNCNSDKANNELLDDSMLNDFKKLEYSTLHIDAVPGPSKPMLSLEYNPNMPENLLDRIKFLEEFESKKCNVIRTLSYSKNVDVQTSESVFSSTKDQFGQVNKEYNKINQEELLFPAPIVEKRPDILPKDVHGIISFQTCTGKGINIADNDIKKSAKLFDDILCPSYNQSARKKKFNYLSKYGNSENSYSLKTPSSTQLDKLKLTRNNEAKSNSVDGMKLYNNSKEVLPPTITSTMANKIDGEKNNPKNSKNIFVGEYFDDLNMLQNRGFKTASVSLQKKLVNDEVILQLPETHQQEHERFGLESVTPAILPHKLQKKTVKNICEDDKFDDFKLAPDSGFETAANLKNPSTSRGLKEYGNSAIFKENIVDTPPTTKKLLVNIFEGENFDDLKLPYNSGFQSASTGLKTGQTINNTVPNTVDVPPCTASKTPKNIFEGEYFDDFNFTENVGFKSASVSLKNLSNVHSISTDQQAIKKSSMEFDKSILKIDKQSNTGQGVKRTLLTKPANEEPPAKRNIFKEENFDDLNLNFKGFQSFKSGTFNLKTASSTMTNLNHKPTGFKNIFADENFDDLNIGALGPKFQSPLTKSKNNYVQNQNFESPYRTPVKNPLQQKLNNQSDDNFYGFNQEEKEIALSISESHCGIVNIVESRFKEIMSQENSNKPLINLSCINGLCKKVLKFKAEYNLTDPNRTQGKKRKFFELDSDANSLPQKRTNTTQPKSFLKRPKKRLGCHVSPTIQISETVLKKVKLLFEDLNHKPVETSTPNKFDRSLATPLGFDLTPIQSVRKRLGSSFTDVSRENNCSRSFNKSISLEQTLVRNNARFGLNKPSEGDVRVWMENLSCEKRLLEEMLRIVDEKQTILSNQRTILEFSAKEKQRILPGVLYNSKSRKDKIYLKDLSTSSQSDDMCVTNFVNQVNPQNSHLVHFYIQNRRQSHIQTQDGAVIVPSTEGRIGISEIEHSFKVMEGVDSKLLPKGWIQNHYKWIVWKLASYERRFFEKFDGCLCIENVVQQLKYRYDIEIDNVKRSALHKIFEKDDCPQRRLVLCVSRIIKVANSYDLELTDGWYPIRTVIDPFLCDQILKGKIKLGVKLMTYNAELVNCEGCHPLEATDQIYLKINYNSTRRAAWWAKLGCQKDSGPFLVSLPSINMEGGKIGCIKCFILRVYPVKYMEKCGDTNVWRNRKAEERREQEFYNEKIKTLETTDDSLCNKRNDLYLKKNNPDLLKSIRNIDDPEVLYEILQRSSDPESIQENLSSSQKTILYNYTMNKSAQVQSRPIKDFNDKPKVLQERSVTSLLKIKIVDASCDSNVVYDFHVWRPQDSHVQELREGEVVTIFNVSCSSKWGLNANKTTQFKTEKKSQDIRYQKFRRHVTSIEELKFFSKENEILPEFDTVGIIVKKKVGEHQQVWLTDYKENLLVIKIYDSPKTVLLLDTVSEGQIVTVCNLVFKQTSEAYTFAMADHFTIFSRYSQYRHLQEAAESVEKEFKNKDLTFLQLCKNKVDKIESKWDCRSPNLAWDLDDMDCSQITTTDLALLECVDKLT